MFLIAACAVNPLRQCPMDDDWAYAETVHHFLETGEYRLNNWLAANIGFPTIWGALFCEVAGYSFGALRVSTIALALIGLAAFRALALEHRLSRPAANLLTLAIATSPLLFKMSLTFMSDVPFFATLTVALWLYTRAMRRMNWTAWLLASIAGSLAILTRQFGVALIGGLALVWLTESDRIPRLPKYALGALFPIAAMLWQLQQGWSHPNWGSAYNLHRLKLFLGGSAVWKALPWRPLVIVEYFAWFLMPLVLVAAIAVVARREKNAVDDVRGEDEGTTESEMKSRGGSWLYCGASLIVFVGGLFYGAAVLGPSRMPFLPWNFELLKHLPKLAICATVIAVAGGTLFAPRLLRRVLCVSDRPRDVAERMLDATALCLFLFMLMFFQLGDEYLLAFLPFVAIVIGRQLETTLLRWHGTFTAVCLILLIGAAVWTREELCRSEAIWTLAEQLHAQGIPTENISEYPYGGWAWAGYYHFDDYAREVPPTAHSTFSDVFVRWVPQMRQRAEYWIVHDLQPPGGERWQTVDRLQYFSLFSRGRETFYAVRRERT